MSNIFDRMLDEILHFALFGDSTSDFFPDIIHGWPRLFAARHVLLTVRYAQANTSHLR